MGRYNVGMQRFPPAEKTPPIVKPRQHLTAAAGLLIVFVAILSVCNLAFSAGQFTGERARRDSLWAVVRYICVAGEMLAHNPAPCVSVDLAAGIDKGFAILPYPGGANHFLLVPTAPIAGIESPVLRDPGAVNYFALAWNARAHLSAALHVQLVRDSVGLAVNSAVSRSQDQLHIHIGCVRPDVYRAMREHESSLKTQWTPFDVPLAGRRYMARWVPEDHLTSNPFALLAAGVPDAKHDMANRTLVVIGLNRPNGSVGFVLLENRVNRAIADFAGGEELLDYSCRIASTQP